MQEVEKYYDEHAQAEWERLERHPMEFALTMQALQEYLVPESRILDVEGGRDAMPSPLPIRDARSPW